MGTGRPRGVNKPAAPAGLGSAPVLANNILDCLHPAPPVVAAADPEIDDPE